MLNFIDFQISLNEVSSEIDIVSTTKTNTFWVKIPLKYYLQGLIENKFIDSYSDDLQTVTIGLPDVSNYSNPKTFEENEGGEITEDAIDVIKETFGEAGKQVFKWWIHQKLYKKLPINF